MFSARSYLGRRWDMCVFLQNTQAQNETEKEREKERESTLCFGTYLIISEACSRDKEEANDGNVYLLIISKMSRLSLCVSVCAR